MPVWQIVLLASALFFAGISIFLWLWNVLRAKKLRAANFVPQKLINKKNKIPFKMDKFIDTLGGIENIISSTATNNKIKIQIANHDKVDFLELKKIKNRGILDQSKAISIVLGNYAPDLSNIINDLVALNKENKQQEL